MDPNRDFDKVREFDDLQDATDGDVLDNLLDSGEEAQMGMDPVSKDPEIEIPMREVELDPHLNQGAFEDEGL